MLELNRSLSLIPKTQKNLIATVTSSNHQLEKPNNSIIGEVLTSPITTPLTGISILAISGFIMVKNIMANQNGQTTLIQDNDNDIDKSVIELEERYYKDVNSQIQFESLPKNIGSFSLITQESNEPFLKQGRLSFYGKANKEPYISFKHKSGYLFNIGLLAWRDGNSKEKSNYINAQKAYLEASKEFQTNYKDPKVRDNYHQTEKLKRKSYTQFMDFFKNQTKLLNQDVITEGIVKLLNKLDLESHNVPNHILNKVTWNLAGEDYQSDELVAAADPSTDIVHIQCSKIDNFDIKLSKYKKIDKKTSLIDVTREVESICDVFVHFLIFFRRFIRTFFPPPYKDKKNSDQYK